MNFVLASRNRKKIAELNALLQANLKANSSFRLLSLDDIGYTGDIAEDGASFEENACLKAAVPASMGYWGIADDSGLCVDALGGAPGIYSARFSDTEGFTNGNGGEIGDIENIENIKDIDERNNDLLLTKLAGLPATERKAKFVCVIALCPPYRLSESITFRGECPGIITEEPRGRRGFGYDPLFLYEPLSKTFAEIPEEEKNMLSHRARAAELFAKRLNTDPIYSALFA